MRQLVILCAAVLAVLLVTACKQEQPPAQQRVQSETEAVQPPAESALPESEQASPIAEKGQPESEPAMTERDQAPGEVKPEAALPSEKGATKAVEPKELTQAPVAEAPAEEEPAATMAPPMPQVVTYEASKGKVSFDHAGHAGRLACSSCHTTDPPQKISLTMASAHKLCRGCHQETGGAAPQACSGCHKE